MRLKCSLLMATALAAATLAGTAAAAELKKIAEIAIPGVPLEVFDISFVDQKTQRYYLADRSNKAIDVFDAKDNKFIGRAEGFIGATVVNGKVDNSVSGPNGVMVIGDQAWAGDGDSNIKIVDLKSMKIVESIPTGGKKRANEMTYDPKDEIGRASCRERV